MANSLGMMGNIIIAFAAILVGIALFTSSAQLIGDVVNTYDVANESVASANGTTLANIVQLQGKFVTDVEVYNGSDDMVVGSGNYTIYQNQVINGVETAGINVSSDVTQQGQAWNVSYTTQPTTYDANSGGRAVAGLILIFFGLAIAMVAIYPVLKERYGW